VGRRGLVSGQTLKRVYGCVDVQLGGTGEVDHSFDVTEAIAVEDVGNGEITLRKSPGKTTDAVQG